MDFEQGLVIELSGISGLSKKIFPLSAPECTSVPYAVYSRGSTNRLRTLEENHTDDQEPLFQIDIFHSNYGSLRALMNGVSEKLKTIWNRNIGASGPYVQSIEIINGFEIFEAQVNQHHGIIEFRVFY